MSCEVFDNDTDKKKFREGASYETDTLIRVCRKLNLYVSEHKNLKRDQFVSLIENIVKNEMLRDFSSLMIFLSSHGGNIGRRGNIFLSDSKPVSIDWIISRFADSQCPLLKGKPKMVFTTCCR